MNRKDTGVKIIRKFSEHVQHQTKNKLLLLAEIQTQNTGREIFPYQLRETAFIWNCLIKVPPYHTGPRINAHS